MRPGSRRPRPASAHGQTRPGRGPVWCLVTDRDRARTGRRPQGRHCRRRQLRPGWGQQAHQGARKVGCHRARGRAARRGDQARAEQRHSRPDLAHHALDRVRRDCRCRWPRSRRLRRTSKSILLLQEANRHCKAFGVWGDGARTVENAGVSLSDAGVSEAEVVGPQFVRSLITALGQHRDWARAKRVVASAVAPAGARKAKEKR